MVRNKILLFSSIALFIGLVVWVVFLLARPERVDVEIFAVPSDSEITMDGQPIKAGKATITAGEHTFTASRQYFESIVKEVNTNDLTAAKTIYLAIYPNSPEGEAYLATHPDEQLRYERVSGAEFSALQEKLYTQYPITTELPYQTTDFKIDYNVTPEQTVVYLVSLYPVAAVPGSELYKQQLLTLQAEALNWLKEKGLNTSEAQIKFSPDPETL